MGDNMLRSKSTYILVALIAVIIVAGIFLFSRNSTLSIQNNTDVTISGLKIKYSNSLNDTELPDILPKQIYNSKIILPQNFTEGSIKIFYLDKQGKNHEEYLSGYIEKGYKVKISVNIVSVDSNGILSIEINRTE